MSTSAREKRRSMQDIKAKVFDQVWDVESEDLARFRRLFHSLIKISLMVVRDFVENLLKLQAMALAFKTLLSLAPLLAVVFSILKAFGVHNRMEPALSEALAPLGEKGQEITAYLIGFVDKMSAGALGRVGMEMLCITVLSIQGSLDEAVNLIWC